MTSSKRRSCGRHLAAMGLATGLVLASTPARAEYVENSMGRGFATVTLATAGSIALGFDVANVVYLAGGTGDQAGRVVTGIASSVGGATLIVGGVLVLGMVGEDHVPGGGGNLDSPEGKDLRVARTLSAINIGLGVSSIGLGIASIATFRSQSAPTTNDGALEWRLLPVVLPGRGGALGLARAF